MRLGPKAGARLSITLIVSGEKGMNYRKFNLRWV